MPEDYMQIGEVAERAGLSLRTIRYYEEEGLVGPAKRSAGGFRLYTDAEVERLLLLRRAKPLGFSLDELRDLLAVLDGLRRARQGEDRSVLRERLALFADVAQARVETLREQLEAAESFAAQLCPDATAELSRSREVGR